MPRTALSLSSLRRVYPRVFLKKLPAAPVLREFAANECTCRSNFAKTQKRTFSSSNIIQQTFRGQNTVKSFFSRSTCLQATFYASFAVRNLAAGGNPIAAFKHNSLPPVNLRPFAETLLWA